MRTASPLPHEPGPAPARNCDIVMKGGITSGVVYPRAVCELARAFRFRNIGGTSAGAIAAAVTAAAEYGRSREGVDAFADLERMPAELGRDYFLSRLFQPQTATRPLFALFTALVGHDSRRSRAGRLLRALARHYLLPLGLGLALGGLAGWCAIRGSAGALRPLGMLTAVALTLAAPTILLSLQVLLQVRGRLSGNGFGLCRGFDPGEHPGSPGLVTWLDTTLQRLAGRTDRDPPLTFGDLWGTTWGRHLPPNDRREINLEMMTTNLTQGRPHRLPFDQAHYFFNPDEWRRYFPDRIVEHLKEGSARTGLLPRPAADGVEVLPLPCPHDLPVLVATRLSLSFPLLISAVPLYAVNYSRPGEIRHLPERCWLSDGGICSNFPVHFFDSLVPRWPTFAINLRPFTRDYPRQPSEADNVYMTRRNGDGTAAWWTHFDVDETSWQPLPGLAPLAGFLGAILTTALGWRDNAQLSMPGFRDRVVHVKLDESVEGGLNLRMDEATITPLAARGAEAGKLLRKRYAEVDTEPGVDVSWPNHRWVRYRNAMALLQRTLESVDRAMGWVAEGEPSYEALVRRGPDDPPPSYRWSRAQSTAGPWPSTALLRELVRDWRERRMDFHEGAPAPYPELRPTPRV